MNIAFYSAVTGMKAFQEKLDVTSNNMANLNTAGYKTRNTSFQDLLYNNMNTKAEGEHLMGHGTRVADVDYVFQQGNPKRTDRSLDFAILGKGFFAVDNGGAEPVYTRDGQLSLSVEAGGTYLVTGDGGYVLDFTGRRIQVTDTSEAGIAQLKDRIGLYTFENPEGLTSIGGNLLAQSDLSGAWNVSMNGPDIRLINGALEDSTVQVSDEMVNLITAQRAFQVNGRMVSAADQIEEMINNLR